MSSIWRIFIVEDDLDNAHYVADNFTALGHDVRMCHDGDEALKRALTEHWDLIILDRMLPNDMDGLFILETLRKKGMSTPVLVLSALSALDERVRGLKAGGDDYLSKPFAFPELAARAEVLIRRNRFDSHRQVLQLDDLKIDLVTRQVERGDRTISLQPREFRLLAYLMINAGQIVTRSMLLESVWDLRFDPQTNVIEMQMSRLRSKLDGKHDRPLIHTVRGIGYRMTDIGEDECGL